MADDKLLCRNTGCDWNRKGRCVLFVGITMLECRYRKPPTRAQKTTPTTKTKKKGK